MPSETFGVQSLYYSGQGVVMIAQKNAVTGLPMGYKPLGNVSDLKIDIATTVVDHKGAQDGQRSIDARLQTETKPSVSVTIDNWIAANLAQALRGAATTIAAGTVTGETHSGYVGLITGLQYINLVAGSLVLTNTANSTTLTPYTNATTPYDYQVNEAAGSFQINPGTSVGFGTLGTTATGVTVGSTTAITVPNDCVVGQQVYLQGFTGANASLLNNKWATVTAASGTAISVNISTTGMTITTGASSVVVNPNDILSLSAAYGYQAQYLTDALTTPLTAVCLRFEGLNTVESNQPVVVEIFKFSVDPLKELALISDTFGQFVLEGELLSDGTRTSGSKYFEVKALQ